MLYGLQSTWSVVCVSVPCPPSQAPLVKVDVMYYELKYNAQKKYEVVDIARPSVFAHANTRGVHSHKAGALRGLTADPEDRTLLHQHSQARRAAALAPRRLAIA